VPRFLFTAELRDPSGRVVATRRKHFTVLSPGQMAQQDIVEAMTDLAMADAALLAAEREVIR
jgi:hypothetical protein